MKYPNESKPKNFLAFIMKGWANKFFWAIQLILLTSIAVSLIIDDEYTKEELIALAFIVLIVFIQLGNHVTKWNKLK